MAGQLYEALRIPVTEAQALQRPCYFGGHSLGGSLALLLAVLFRLRLPLSPHLLQCCTFGSPPVLSHGGGGGGNGVVRVHTPVLLSAKCHNSSMPTPSITSTKQALPPVTGIAHQLRP